TAWLRVTTIVDVTLLWIGRVIVSSRRLRKRRSRRRRHERLQLLSPCLDCPEHRRSWLVPKLLKRLNGSKELQIVHLGNALRGLGRRQRHQAPRRIRIGRRLSRARARLTVARGHRS